MSGRIQLNKDVAKFLETMKGTHPEEVAAAQTHINALASDDADESVQKVAQRGIATSFEALSKAAKSHNVSVPTLASSAASRHLRAEDRRKIARGLKPFVNAVRV